MGSDWVTSVAAIIGVVSGVAGSVLGIVSVWHIVRRDRVRLKVIPQHAIPVGTVSQQGWNFVIEVVNLSDFAVTVTDVGLRLADGSSATVSPTEGLEPQGRLPIRLEPRMAYSKILKIDRDTLDWGRVRSAYARTQCGSTATGTSGALEQLVRQGQADAG